MDFLLNGFFLVYDYAREEEKCDTNVDCSLLELFRGKCDLINLKGVICDLSYKWSSGWHFREVVLNLFVSLAGLWKCPRILPHTHHFTTNIRGYGCSWQCVQGFWWKPEVALLSSSSLEDWGLGLGVLGDTGTTWTLTLIWHLNHSLSWRPEVLMEHFHVFFCSFL